MRCHFFSTGKTSGNIFWAVPFHSSFPAGNFKKGDPTALKDVYLNGFWMGKTEVPVAQYLEFARKTGSNYPQYMDKTSPHHIESGDGYYNGQEGDDYPIVGISWKNAAEWCEDVFPGEGRGTRAVRGGSFYDKDRFITCFSRNGMKSSERTNSLGFRLCLVGEK